MDWGALANAATQGTLGTASMILGGIQTKKARDIDLQNFQLQKDAFQWQKDQHQIMMDREDNAVQRRMADLEAAGLHPALAAGSPAAAHQGPQPATPQRENRELEVAQMMQNLMMQQAQVGRTFAETSLINAQKRRYDSQTQLDIEREKASVANRDRLGAVIDTMTHNLDIAKSRGFMTTESSEMIRRFEYILELAKSILNRENNFTINFLGENLRDNNPLPTRGIGYESDRVAPIETEEFIQRNPWLRNMRDRIRGGR